jgi:hypothetical protein
MDANNFSRGNKLVELALARQSRDNETEINEPISIPNAATFLRIQGQILETFRKNKSSSLECDESDNFDSGEENHIDFDDSMKDPDWIPEQDVNNNNNNQNLIERNNLETDESRDNQNDAERVLGEDRNNGIDENENAEETVPVRKRKKKEEWCKNVNKRLRMEGKQYKGVSKNEEGAKTYCVDRNERIVSPRGCSKTCNKSKKRKCLLFTDNERKEIFNRFWTMTWDEKRVFVCSLVEKRDVKQRTLDTDSRRNCSFLYFLRKENGKFPVCKSMFLSTLGIGERMMYDWVMKSTNGIPNKEHYQRPQRQEESNKKIFARNFLMSLPKLPSHYCRASSSKLYLEPVFASVSELHREYKKQAIIDEKPILSRPPFLNLLEEQNISLFKPRKDQCDICCSY